MHRVRVATWNLERKKSTSPRGAEALGYLASLNAEVIVATEARTSFAPSAGHTVSAEPPLGKRFGADERKVVVWSRNPLAVVDLAPGIDRSRFVAVRTNTSIGPLLVLGVCIPWHMAEVTYPSGPKKKPWQEHLEYLTHLRPVLDDLDEPYVVAGDFNQRTPRVNGANKAVAAALDATFSATEIVTAGIVPGCEKPGIDHIAINSHLEAHRVQGWPANVTGNRLSDHDGAFVDIAMRG